MTPDINFETMFFNPFSTKECILDNDHDPDVNFYHDVSMLDTQNLMPDKFKTNFKDFSKNSFSVLHLIPTINKPTRVGKNSATAVDHIITDYVLTCDFKIAILKTDLTDYFPIVIALKNYGLSQQHSITKHKYKRSYNEENMEAFNQRLLSVNWDEVKNCDDPNDAYKQFFNIFNSICDIYFPKVSVRLKTKHIQSPCITKGIAKSSKRKQKL